MASFGVRVIVSELACVVCAGLTSYQITRLLNPKMQFTLPANSDGMAPLCRAHFDRLKAAVTDAEAPST